MKLSLSVAVYPAVIAPDSFFPLPYALVWALSIFSWNYYRDFLTGFPTFRLSHTCHSRCLSKTDRTPGVNCKVSCGLWVIMMCQFRFPLGSKCTTVVSGVDNGEAVRVVGEGCVGGLCTSLFYDKRKTALKE